MVNQEDSQNAGLVAHSRELPEQQQKGKSTVEVGSTSFRGLSGHAAAALGLKQGVQLLSENGANIGVIGGEPYGAQGEGAPLDSAAFYGLIDVLRLLLKQGENIEAMRGDNGSTPLSTAADRGHTAVVRLLLVKGANIEATRSDGSTALYTVSSRGHLGVMRLLLEKGTNIESSNPEATAIATGCQRCFQDFRDFGDILRNSEAHAENLQSTLGHPQLQYLSLEQLKETHEALEELFERFKMWTAICGAYLVGRMSLDHRLREATHVHLQVVNLLEDLENALKEGKYSRAC